jgi:predicted RNA-binding protein YlqC (UPF0109 family)
VRDLLEYLARELATEPDVVRVEEHAGDEGSVLRLVVAPADLGRMIGRGGRTARALRTVVRAAGSRESRRPAIEIVAAD